MREANRKVPLDRYASAAPPLSPDAMRLSWRSIRQAWNPQDGRKMPAGVLVRVRGDAAAVREIIRCLKPADPIRDGE